MSAEVEPMEIVEYPDPFLNKKARAITAEELKAGKTSQWDLKELVERMRVTMYEARGIGLAAPQVGVGLRLFVVDVSDDRSEFFEVINPVLTETEGTVTEEEGCLSIPGVRAKVKRFARLTLTGTNLKGEKLSIPADDLLARCFQHETDHLDGVLFISKISMTGRLLVRRALNDMEEQYELKQARAKKKK